METTTKRLQNQIENGHLIERATTGLQQNGGNFFLNGVIKCIKPFKGYGFIKDECGLDFYFKYNPLFHSQIQEGDQVVFKKFTDPFKNKQFAGFVIKAYISRDGYKVIDKDYSHVHDNLDEKLPEIINRIVCNNQKNIVQEIKFPCIIGETKCVEITSEDKIIYAQRIGRPGSTKFVLNRFSKPTDTVTIVIQKYKNIYEILTCYKGTKSEVEPYDLKASEASFLFWETHALVFRTEPIDETSIQEICPWPKMPFRKLLNGEF